MNASFKFFRKPLLSGTGASISGPLIVSKNPDPERRVTLHETTSAAVLRLVGTSH